MKTWAGIYLRDFINPYIERYRIVSAVTKEPIEIEQEHGRYTGLFIIRENRLLERNRHLAVTRKAEHRRTIDTWQFELPLNFINRATGFSASRRRVPKDPRDQSAYSEFPEKELPGELSPTFAFGVLMKSLRLAKEHINS